MARAVAIGVLALLIPLNVALALYEASRGYAGNLVIGAFITGALLVMLVVAIFVGHRE